MIRYHRSLNYKLCQLEIGNCQLYELFGTLCEIKVFGFWGKYDRKVET